MRPIAREAVAMNGRIIVVDDHPANLNVLDTMLSGQGYEVRSFPLGRLAIAAAERTPPDLFLLDINMPEMNGYEVCERLKSHEQLADIPVIFLSALSDVEDKIRGFQAGAVDYVSKPFRMEEVLARVSTHVRMRHLQCAIEGDNSRLREVVEAQVKKIAEGHLAAIFAIAKLAGTRDGETGMHLERIQTYCRILGEQAIKCGVYPDEIDSAWIMDLTQASPLHDIGKVGIPDRILLKAGSLTDEEFELMKTHTTLGAETLRSVQNRYPDNRLIAMGIEIAQSHHERWDGTGYPEGLRATAIPLTARILAVADCYDALRSFRSYKPSISHLDAVRIILTNAETQFDPAVAELFARAVRTFGEISDHLSDDPHFVPLPESRMATYELLKSEV